MTEYYFLTSLLPELQIGHIPTLGFSSLMELLETDLTKEDFQLVKHFLHIIDYDNLRSLWNGDPIDKRGNFTKEELERALLEGEWPNGKEFPDYLLDFLQKYPNNKERVQHFFWLISRFLDDQIVHHTDFFREYYIFEKQWRLVMVGFRAKKYGKDISYELQYEDPYDPIVAQILAQKDTQGFEPPFEYRDLKPIFDEYADNPLELHKALLEYQFRQIVELTGNEIFSIDRILGYLARLLLVESWLVLDVQKGINVVDEMVEKIQ